MARYRYYTVEPGGKIVGTDNFLEWGRWLEGDSPMKPFLEGGRRVAWTTLNGEDSFVSTVFLGLDHNLSGKDLPILFETMICRKGEWSEQWRDVSYETALNTHRQAAQFARGEIAEEEVQT